MLLQFLLLVGLLITGSFGPGWWLVRRRRWSLLERLVAATASSGVVLYLAAGLLYGLQAPLLGYAAVSAAGVALTLAAWRDIAALAGDRAVRQVVGGFGALLIWMLLLLALTRGYSGAKWEVDWREHYQRAQFFIQHLPVDTLMADGRPLPARPPFMNLVAGFFLHQVGDRFEWFQVAAVWLNLLVYFPACLLVRRFFPYGVRATSLLVLSVLVAASPMVTQNSTYPWTKGFANFYVLLGIASYVRALGRRDSARLTTAFLALSAGVLVHYSAAPYLVLVALHHLVHRRHRSWAETGGVAAACALLVATWIGWSAATYGPELTFGSNTTAAAAEEMTVAQSLAKIGANLAASIVPHPLRIGWDEFSATFVQPSRWGLLRDYLFTIGQTNLVFALGTVAWVAVFWLAWREMRAGGVAASGERRFWGWLVGAGTVVTIATHPTFDPYGVAHVCSQPLVWIGLCFLAARATALPVGLRWCLVAGAAIDFLGGVLLHFSLQHWVYDLVAQEGRDVLVFREDMLSVWAARNLAFKQALGLSFLGDHFVGGFRFLQAITLGLFALLLDRLVRGFFGPGWKPRITVAGILLGAGVFLSVVPTRAPPILPNPADPVAAAAAVNANPESAEAHFNHGLALYLQGRMGACVAELVEALTLQPDHARARYCLDLLVTIYRGPVPPAVQRAEELRLNPKSAAAQHEIAIELLRGGHVAAAQARWREALRLDPGHAAAAAALQQLEQGNPAAVRR